MAGSLARRTLKQNQILCLLWKIRFLNFLFYLRASLLVFILNNLLVVYIWGSHEQNYAAFIIKMYLYFAQFMRWLFVIVYILGLLTMQDLKFLPVISFYWLVYEHINSFILAWRASNGEWLHRMMQEGICFFLNKR